MACSPANRSSAALSTTDSAAFQRGSEACVCIYMCICMYVCMHVCMYVCMHLCVCHQAAPVPLSSMKKLVAEKGSISTFCRMAGTYIVPILENFGPIPSTIHQRPQFLDVWSFIVYVGGLSCLTLLCRHKSRALLPLHFRPTTARAATCIHAVDIARSFQFETHQAAKISPGLSFRGNGL